MPNYKRNTKNGQFTGSVGKGKTATPTPSVNEPRRTVQQPHLISSPRQYASLNTRTQQRIQDVLEEAHTRSGSEDEGFEYDYDKQVKLLLAAGWKMPEILPQNLPTKKGSRIIARAGTTPETQENYAYLTLTSKGWAAADGTIVEVPNLNEDEGKWWLMP